jgi:hypothetical protein
MNGVCLLFGQDSKRERVWNRDSAALPVPQVYGVRLVGKLPNATTAATSERESCTAAAGFGNSAALSVQKGSKAASNYRQKMLL